MTYGRGLGIALVVGGAVLALLVPDLEVLWFQGRPFGILLVVLGVVELADGARRSRGQRRTGLLQELRGDLGLTRADEEDPPRRNPGTDSGEPPSERSGD